MSTRGAVDEVHKCTYRLVRNLESGVMEVDETSLPAELRTWALQVRCIHNV